MAHRLLSVVIEVRAAYAEAGIRTASAAERRWLTARADARLVTKRAGAVTVVARAARAAQL
ncbi:MAG TPA: hypothetical protein VGC45_06020 [Gryllotalpicola sp.]